MEHDLVVAVKQLALELGKTPARHEFENSIKGGRYKIDKFFGGSYTALLQAAGLEISATEKKRRRIDNTVFEKSLEKHLEQYIPRPVSPTEPYPTAAIISDIHWPFQSDRVIEKFLKYVQINQPEYVIINGDAWDFYSFSRYPRSHNIFTPREEERMARERNEKFWRDVQKASPNSKCVQLTGNHCVRPLKQILEAYPAAEDWIQEHLKRQLTFDGVRTILDPREELFLRDDIIVMHGYRSRLGQHRDYTLVSCFTGHTHKGGVLWRSLANGKQIFECNSGVAGDPESKGLSYTSQKIHDMTPGFAAMDEWGPRFIPA